MTETLLRDFFLGLARPEELGQALEGSATSDASATRYSIEDMHEEFLVEPRHLVQTCDAYLAGHLAAEHLRFIGFCLLASDAFLWDGESPEGERVTAVGDDWANPEIHHLTTPENAERWRRYLLGDPKAFSRDED